jgi:hypothetical protein
MSWLSRLRLRVKNQNLHFNLVSGLDWSRFPHSTFHHNPFPFLGRIIDETRRRVEREPANSSLKSQVNSSPSVQKTWIVNSSLPRLAQTQHKHQFHRSSRFWVKSKSIDPLEDRMEWMEMKKLQFDLYYRPYTLSLYIVRKFSIIIIFSNLIFEAQRYTMSHRLGL